LLDSGQCGGPQFVSASLHPGGSLGGQLPGLDQQPVQFNNESLWCPRMND
jgi:hypothetical protein